MGILKRKNKARAFVIDEEAEPTLPEGERVSVAGSHARLVRRSRNRIGLCAVVFCVAFGVLAMRLSYLSIDMGGAFAAHASHGKGAGLAGKPLGKRGEREEIFDRNGVILATNLPMITLEIAGNEVWDAGETVQKLSEIIEGLDAASLEKKLSAGRYVQINKALTPAKQAAVFDLGLPGVRFQSRPRRYYPQRDLAAHVVGHTTPGEGGVLQGAMGLEAFLETAPKKLTKNKEGLVSSIDISAQQIIEIELNAAIEKYHAKAGWAGVLDVTTGEVIAIASLPDFDPNNPGAVEPDWRRNRATYDRYELGSAFKAITAASILDAGIATEITPYDARGAYKIGGKRIGDFHGKNRVLTLAEVIQYSSNIGIAKAVADLGVERQKAALEAVGLFEALPIELQENRAPQLPQQWGPVEAATVSYGHGISVTPLHLLTAFAAVVNGGVYQTPTFLKVEGEAPKGARVFSEQTSATMRRILRGVITDGTARYAEAEGYYPIGKTATADKPAAGGYDRSTRIASFVGAFPGHKPRYAIIVSLDEPQVIPETKGYATAGWNAAPTFARMVARLAPTLGAMPASEGQALAAFWGASGLNGPRAQ